MSGRVVIGDALTELRNLPDESVNCVVTSPPYWGLRDYGTASWEGGDPACEHKGRPKPRQDTSGGTGGSFTDTRGTQPAKAFHAVLVRSSCICGAQRIDQQLGLEETPQEYVEKMVAVFAEVRRVLRSDGTCWVNLGDCYSNIGKWGGSTSGKHAKSLHGGHQTSSSAHGGAIPGLKPKDMVGIPWRVAFALQADGWFLRSDIIWHKPQPMPESVSDRPTKAHEYLFLLTKSAQYTYDADAIKEPASAGSHRRASMTALAAGKNEAAAASRPDGHSARTKSGFNERWRVKQNESFAAATADLVETRNKRSVWTIATQANPDAHFATFPEDLVTPCVLAGCPGGGVVLDPFGGTGTVARVAEDLGRHWLLIELNPGYCAMAERRMAQRGLLGLLDSPPTTPSPLPASGPRPAPDGVSAVPGSALGTHDGDGVVGDLSQNLAAADTSGHSQADIEDQTTRTGDAPGAKTASPSRNWTPRGECLNRPEGQAATPAAAKAPPRISIVLVDAAGVETVFAGGAS